MRMPGNQNDLFNSQEFSVSSKTEFRDCHYDQKSLEGSLKRIPNGDREKSKHHFSEQSKEKWANNQMRSYWKPKQPNLIMVADGCLTK